MRGLTADVNIRGQFLVLLGILESDRWLNLWREFNLAVYDFADLGLARQASDLEIWSTWQQQEVVLLTANRNLEGEESLEAAIRRFNTPSALPVFTLSHADRILRDKQYAQDIAESLFEHLLDIDLYRGLGRVYIS